LAIGVKALSCFAFLFSMLFHLNGNQSKGQSCVHPRRLEQKRISTSFAILSGYQQHNTDAGLLPTLAVMAFS
jgi:hypothetical protein